MDKTIAVVVTYNRLESLSECISALRNQTKTLDKILVINNGSTDGTERWLQQQDDLEFITQKNVGSAGGFYTGIKDAFDKGYSWMWLMDDDGYPKENALENLLKDATEELCLRNCAVINKEDKKSFVWKTQNYSSINEVKERIINNVAHPFNGTLLHRRIVERVGLPKQNLFLWGDETEYYYRIIKTNSIPFCTIADSIHYHPASAFSYKQDWNYTTSWKMYYYVRNRFAILQSKFSKNAFFAFLMYAGFLMAFAGTILFFQKTNKVKKLTFIFWPAADALTKNFKATPTFILERLNTSNKTGNYFANQLKVVKMIFSGASPAELQKLERA